MTNENRSRMLAGIIKVGRMITLKSAVTHALDIFLVS